MHVKQRLYQMITVMIRNEQVGNYSRIRISLNWYLRRNYLQPNSSDVWSHFVNKFELSFRVVSTDITHPNVLLVVPYSPYDKIGARHRAGWRKTDSYPSFRFPRDLHQKNGVITLLHTGTIANGGILGNCIASCAIFQCPII